jgi:hypothetical protein
MEMVEMVVQAVVVVVTITLLVELLRHQVKVIMAEHQEVVVAILRVVVEVVLGQWVVMVMLVLEALLEMVELDFNLQLQEQLLIMLVEVVELKINSLELQGLEA